MTALNKIGVLRRIFCKQVLSFQRLLSSSVMGPTIEEISPFVRLHTFNNENSNAPLLLLCPWAAATERGLDRYRTLYARRGFNVLTAYINLGSYMWPKSVEPIAANLLEYIRTETGESPIVVHAFSIGAFLYAMALKQVLADKALLDEIRPRIVGHVFDSIIIGTLKEQQIGISRLTSNNWFMQGVISNAAALYFFIFKGCVVVIFERAIEAFIINPFTTSILCYYSLADPMCQSEAMESFMAEWEKRTGRRAHHMECTDAKHAGFLHAYPVEYKDKLYKYLDSLNIKGETTVLQSKM